jgi:zinc transport system substrate-binding protein
MNNIFHYLKITLLLLLPIFTFSGVSFSSDDRMKIIASIAPLADFSRQIGGDAVDVALLLPPGASPHTFEPTPGFVQKISDAEIYIKIGAGLEFWADRLITTANNTISVVECSRGIDLLERDSPLHSGSRPRYADPHIWLDPVISISIIRKIEKALSAKDPARTSYFKKRAADYIEKLMELDREIADTVATFRTKEYITFHQGWNYFSHRYSLKLAGVIEEGPGKEPSPRHLNRILAELRRMEVKVIFAEHQFSPRIAEAIADEAGGNVLFLDPVGGQGKRKTYLDMMRYNLSVMKRAMK